MCSLSGNDTSAANVPRPVTSGKSSSRLTERPTKVGFIGTATRDSSPGRGAVRRAAPQTRDPEPQLWTPDLRRTAPRFPRSSAAANPFALRRVRGTRSRPSLRPHFGCRRAHRLDDILVPGAATQVRGQDFDQVRIADFGLALEHASGEHQKSRSAKPALQAVVLHERPLQRMQRIALGESLDRADLLAVGLNGEHQARSHRLAADEHRAGAAYPVLAADVRPGQAAIVADGVDQSAPRLDANDMPAPIDIQRDLDLFRHAFAWAARSASRMRCGVAGISSIEILNGASASLIALMIAAGAPIAPPSPSPLAPVIVASLRVSR